MQGVVVGFLSVFWYAIGIFAIANILVYRRVFKRSRADEHVAAEAYRSYRTIMLWSACLSVALGGLQTAGGFASPVFPFVLPSADAILVTSSWVVVIVGLVAFLVYLGTRDRAVAEVLARAIVADVLDGRTALAAVRTGLGAVVVILVIVSLATI